MVECEYYRWVKLTREPARWSFQVEPPSDHKIRREQNEPHFMKALGEVVNFWNLQSHYVQDPGDPKKFNNKS